MKNVLDNLQFAERYEELRRVRLNPRRHTAANAHDHSEQVAALAAALAEQDGCSEDEVRMLENLGRAHDIGKVLGTARPEKSLEVLDGCGPLPDQFLALVKWHDTSLPWWKSAKGGQPPSAKAWSRGLIGPLDLDVDSHASEVSAGAALVRHTHQPELLMIRVRNDGYELPKGGIEWDELPTDAALRELREEAAVEGHLKVGEELGHLDYRVRNPLPEHGEHLKRVNYYRVVGRAKERALPSSTRERIWVNSANLAELPVVNEDLRLIARDALARIA